MSEPIDVLVVGPGGCGQTGLMKFLRNNNIKINNLADRDRLKHMPNPNMIPKNVKINKCIFVVNKSFESVCSHFRRGWAKTQIRKLGNIYKLPIEKQTTLDEYFGFVRESGKDFFAIERQFDNWYNAKLPFPVYFLKFEEIPNNVKKLNEYVGNKIDFSTYKINPRKSTKYREIFKDVTILYDEIDTRINKKVNDKELH